MYNVFAVCIGGHEKTIKQINKCLRHIPKDGKTESQNQIK